jgi:hypothetical protein
MSPPLIKISYASSLYYAPLQEIFSILRVNEKQGAASLQ